MIELEQNISNAITRRAELISNLHAENTDTYRLFHGVTENHPGLTIDRYGPQILVQTFYDPLTEAETLKIKSILDEHLDFAPHYVYNHRQDKKAQNIPLPDQPPSDSKYVCRELGVKYRAIGLHSGMDPLLYLDLRVGRRLIKQISEGKTILNLFAYTCGIGVAAAASGASRVWNVDFSATNIRHGRDNARLNNLSHENIRFIHQDVIPVIRQLANLGVKGKARKRKFQKFPPKEFDIVFLDPPTWAISSFGAVDIVNDYQGIFKPALLSTAPGGQIICTNHAASVELDQWVESLEKCALKAERPIKSIQILEPEPDFPSPDKKYPLKIANIKL